MSYVKQSLVIPVEHDKEFIMKSLAYIFLAIGIICILVLAFGWYQGGVRGDQLEWIVNGPPIIGSFAIGAGLALLVASRKK